MAGVAPIRAAGGVVWRVRADVEVLVIHRRRYDDWSLPKGKAEPGERPVATALREVREETGIRATPGPRLPVVHYPVGSPDAPTEKSVEFWAMRPVTDFGFAPGAEVDDRVWLPLSAAGSRLTYDRERAVLARFAALKPPFAAPVILVRHAETGSRWPANDADRPLTPAGVARSRALGDVVSQFGLGRLISATPLRCRQTLSHLAERPQSPVEVDPTFDEGSDAGVAVARLAALAGERPVLVCSQDKLIRAVLTAIAAPDTFIGGAPIQPGQLADARTPKGHGWVVTIGSDRARAIDPID